MQALTTRTHTHSYKHTYTKPIPINTSEKMDRHLSLPADISTAAGCRPASVYSILLRGARRYLASYEDARHGRPAI